MRRLSLLVTSVVWLCAQFAGTAQASIIVQAGFEFSNGTPPAGPPPWLTMSIVDGQSSGTVTATLTATNLTGNEFVSKWYLNLDPALEPTGLVFSAPTKVGAFDAPSVSVGKDKFKADGDGKFDILLEFSTSGGNANRFTAGDSISYTISGIQSLTAASFDFLSAQGGTQGLITAMHVQATGTLGTGSGWVTAPEPATASLLALGCLTLLRRRS